MGTKLVSLESARGMDSIFSTLSLQELSDGESEQVRGGWDVTIDGIKYSGSGSTMSKIGELSNVVTNIELVEEGTDSSGNTNSQIVQQYSENIKVPGCSMTIAWATDFHGKNGGWVVVQSGNHRRPFNG